AAGAAPSRAAPPAAEPPATPTTPAAAPEPAPPEPAAPEPVSPEPAALVPAPAKLVPSLPAVGDGKAPAVVFAALADPDTGDWELDVTDFSGLDVAALERDRTAAMRRESTGRGALEAGSSLLPAGFAVGDPWTLVTAAGAEHHTAAGFRSLLGDGSGTLHLYVRLGKAPAGTEAPALAFRGHLPPSTTLAGAPPQAPAAVGPGVLAQVARALEPRLEPGQRDIVARRPLVDADVKLYAGRFPGGRTHAVFVMAEIAGDMDPPISAVAFLEADGRATVQATPTLPGTVEYLALLDVDGDGLDEVFYEDDYHEGWSVEMIQWDGSTPRPRTVTGDGL
ncbi:MAG: hypothetical protein KDK70_18700, partial [Myxococcales bacterium]|nr:hypothetical protein [Myxococcales bacterium]